MTGAFHDANNGISERKDVPMRFTQKAIAEALAQIGPFVARRWALPVLRCVRIEAQGDGLVTLEATDLENGAIVTCEALWTGGEGPMVIPFADLKAAVAGFKNDPTVEIAAVEGGLIAVSGERLRVIQIEAVTASDWPHLGTPGPTVTTIEGFRLGDVLKRVAVAAGTDQARPILTCVSIEPRPDEDDMIDFVATDSYRMAFYRGDVRGRLDAGVLWPAAGVLKAIKLAGAEPTITITEGRTWFGGEGCVAYTRHVDLGAFPKWRSLLPERFPTVWNFDRRLEAVTALAKLNKEQASMPVVIEVDGDGDAKLSVTKGGAQVFTSRIGGTLTGDAITIALNPRYLTEGLAVLAGTNTKFQAIDSLKPVLLSGADELEYLLMAIRM